MDDGMQDLIARLEAAEVGSRELDAMIWCALRPERIKLIGVSIPYRDTGGRTQVLFSLPPKRAEIVTNDRTAYPHADPVTTSLDAALAMAERALPGWEWLLRTDPVGWMANCWAGGTEPNLGAPCFPSYALTPALALCIAILRAKQIDTASNPR